MENIVCPFCHQLCDEFVLLQCEHPICSKCAQIQFSSELLRTPCDDFPLMIEHKHKEEKQQIHDEKKTVNICCLKCNEKTILSFSHRNIKLSNNQQLPVINYGLGENQQQQQYIPDDMLQWVFQFLNIKELFTKIRFTCSRLDKIVCTSLHSLHCQGLRINVLKFAHEVLPMETQLQELNLMLNNIGDNEVTEIATVFPLMQQLQILDLSWNEIGNIGASAIANSVKHLKQLQVLDISWNPIGKPAMTAISNATKELTKLRKLNISENSQQKAYEQVMYMFYEKETRLVLHYCMIDNISAIEVARILPHLTQLQELFLNNNQIGDTGATAIANAVSNLTQLQALNLNDNQIGDTGAAAVVNSISELTQQLSFSNNRIGDIGAIAIANSISNLTQLQLLDLENNRIGYLGATTISNSLGNLTQLQQLGLGGNQIGDSGITAIATAISKLTQLQELSLFGNQIGDPGSIANCISNMIQLQWLNLSDNQIGDSGAIAVVNSIISLTKLNSLCLQNNNISEPVKQQLKKQFGRELEI